MFEILIIPLQKIEYFEDPNQFNIVTKKLQTQPQTPNLYNFKKYGPC